MFPALRSIFVPLVALAVFAGAGLSLQPQTVRADLAGLGGDDGVWFLESYGAGISCVTAAADRPDLIRLFEPDGLVAHIQDDDPDDALQVLQVASDADIIMCVHPVDGPNGDANVIFDTSGGGEWNEARCSDLDTPCLNEEGVGDDALTVVAMGNTDLDLIAVTFSCNGPSVQTITIDQDDNDDDIEFRIMCKGLRGARLWITHWLGGGGSNHWH